MQKAREVATGTLREKGCRFNIRTKLNTKRTMYGGEGKRDWECFIRKEEP